MKQVIVTDEWFIGVFVSAVFIMIFVADIIKEVLL